MNSIRLMWAVLAASVMTTCVNAQQWVPRQVCRNGVCQTEWVLVNTPVRQTVQRVNQFVTMPRPTVVRVAPLVVPVIHDFPQESFVVGPSADLQVQAVEAMKVGDRQFIRTVRDATNKAREAGKLSALQQARILAAVRLPRIGKEVEQLMAAELEVPMSATGLIDWENFDPEKFLALIEGIIKILLMFGIGA